MRLGSLTLSTTLSAALLSGCSFIGGQPSNHGNPYAQQNAAHQGQYGQQQYGQHGSAQYCQIASPRQPIPRGCRPEQVTIGTSGQNNFQGQQGGYGAQGGFSQQPQFGQPQYTDGGYGSAVGQTAAVAYHTGGPKKSKPRLRGSLSIGAERSIDGDFLDFEDRPDLGVGGYNPQDFNESFRVSGTESSGTVVRNLYTASDQFPTDEFSQARVRLDGRYEGANQSTYEFKDVWLTPLNVKGGLEYIVNDNTTVFANGGYAYAAGNAGPQTTVTATLIKETETQDWIPTLDGNGNAIPGQFTANGAPIVGWNYMPNQDIATIEYEVSDLERFDLEVGARHYFKPIVQSDGYRTVTPFVGASVGASHVNSVDVTLRQTQAFYAESFEAGGTENTTNYTVSNSGESTRLYDSQWLPQGQLNVGAEWQVTPTWALALESGVRIQEGRDAVDFTNAAGDLVEGRKGDTNVSIPLTLRGSVNF